MDKRLFLEFCLIFIVSPLLFICKILPLVMIMPVLWIIALYCAKVLKLGFKDIYLIPLDKEQLGDIFVKFAFIGSAITVFTYLFYPEKFFFFILSHPLVFFVVVVLYPVLSVVPQELIFRRFFFERYGFCLMKDSHIWINSLMFGFMHIVFGNMIAVVFSIFGGYIFAKRYQRTKGLSTVYIEHSLYGLFVFAVGLGEFFYHGS